MWPAEGGGGASHPRRIEEPCSRRGRWRAMEESWLFLLLCVVSCAAGWWCWTRRLRPDSAGREKVGSRTDASDLSEDVSGGVGDGGRSRGRESVALTHRAVRRIGGGGAAGSGGEGRILPRGSTGWPFVGESLEFIACGYTDRPVSFMEKRRNMYGRVFRSHILGRHVIVSTDAEVSRAVLQNDSFVPCYPRSVEVLLGKGSILQREGSPHRRVHGLIAGFLKSSAARASVADAIERALLRSLFSRQEGQLIYLQDLAREVTFQALLKVLVSMEPGEDLDTLKKEFSEFMRGIISLPIILPGTRLYKSLKAKDKIVKLLRRIIKERFEQMLERSSVRDVLDALINETNTSNEQEMLITSVSEGITELMVPGEHSVPVLISLAVKYLTDCPLVLKQLTVENMNLKLEKINSGEPYTWTDYMSLTFTQWVINETLRIGNIVNGVWRKASKDIEINGYLFPKGWSVLASFSSIHLDEENYPNPYEFNPWRWQNKGSSSLSNFTPFGGGKRLCPGLDLSRIEVSAFLHHMVTNFSWKGEKDVVVNFPTVQLKNRMPIRISPISDTQLHPSRIH